MSVVTSWRGTVVDAVGGGDPDGCLRSEHHGPQPAQEAVCQD